MGNNNLLVFRDNNIEFQYMHPQVECFFHCFNRILRHQSPASAVPCFNMLLCAPRLPEAISSSKSMPAIFSCIVLILEIIPQPDLHLERVARRIYNPGRIHPVNKPPRFRIESRHGGRICRSRNARTIQCLRAQ
jgi:hypothetical protein